MEQDINLRDNDKIEAAIEALQKETTEEMLAHTLTVIRKRMKENRHLIPESTVSNQIIQRDPFQDRP